MIEVRKVFQVVILVLGWVLWYFSSASHAAKVAFNPDVYHTSKLPGEIERVRREYEQLRKDQEKRKKDVTELAKDIETYRIRVGNNPKKNKESAEALENALRQKQVLTEKQLRYDPLLKEKLNLYHTLSKTLDGRKQELGQIPAGNPAQWEIEKARKANRVLKVLADRSRFQLQYYQKAFSGPAANVREAADRRNFITELQQDAKKWQRYYNYSVSLIQQIQSQEQFDRQLEKDDAEDDRESQPQTPRAAPALAKATPYIPAIPATPFAPPVVTSTPNPVLQDTDPLEKFYRFLADYAFACVFAFFIAASVSMFLTLQWVDPDNERHKILSSVIIGGLTAIFFVLPFPGLFLGLICFIVGQPLYFQLPLDKMTRTLPLSVALLAGISVILVAILSLIFPLIH